MKPLPVSIGHINAAPRAGFTLIELLVAMAIFGLVAVLMYGGTQWVIQEREIVQQRLGELEELQRTVRMLHEDFGQAVPRTIRDELGRGDRPALLLERGDDIAVELTRHGWRNPSGYPRSNLQRVRYRYNADEAILYRDTWPVLDRVLGEPPRERSLLRGVDSLVIEFLDVGNQWQPDWPPAGAAKPTALPKAIRFTLELSAFGEITRLVEIPG